jgi:hypothetical protein
MANKSKTDDEYSQLTSALGYALSRWALVEDAIGHVFGMMVVGTGNRFPAKAAMDAVINFNTKLSMTQAAAQWSLRPDELKAWTTLRNRLSDRAKSRNELAHFAIVESEPPEPTGRRFSLSPHVGDLDALVAFEGRPPLYDHHQIRAKGESFAKLAGDLDRFAGQLLNARSAA